MTSPSVSAAAGRISAGDALPRLDIEVSLTALVMYAGATWDFHRYHYDRAYVAERGIRAPFMDGQMAGALLARQLMAWGGPDAFVTRLSYRLRAMVYAGDRIVLSGVVIEVGESGGRAFAVCKLNIVKPDGAVVIQDATATVELGT